MKKTTKQNEYEQITIDFEEAVVTAAEDSKEAPPIDEEVKQFTIGAQVIVKPTAQRFCGGNGIPDYARTAYIRGINTDSQTVLIGPKDTGRSYGLLFMDEVTLA